ncbi:MAG: HAMP domain-containing protein [Xanthomonadales bacterium]|nr:HAMP domain-containing protein [Xanthomonadales bacterium]
MRLLSLEGKLAAALAVVLVLAAALAAWATAWWGSPLLGAAVAVLVLALPALVFAHRMAHPVAALIRALAGSVTAFRDGDFSFSIATPRRDEVGELVAAHNELGRVLREQRQHLFQRELLLDTVVQNTPTALVLVDDRERVVYANLAARQLLHGGRPFAGEDLDEVLSGLPAPVAAALAQRADGLFSVAGEDGEETFHLSQRRFTLRGRVHHLYQFKRLTRELARAEVATWKKVIRVISHELNNSLGPIRSLSHSGREWARLGDGGRLVTVFDTIEERTRHLEGFIQGYARFARLPAPRPEAVEWAPFLASLAQHYAFRIAGPVPAGSARFDRAQVEQALINLLKNAHEAGGDAAAIELAVAHGAREWRIEVSDRGGGMNEAVLANALLPFYSTKRNGSGLGLALAREVAEAHEGRLHLANRGGGGLVASLVLPLG